MGGAQAAMVMRIVAEAGAKRKGETLDPAVMAAQEAKIVLDEVHPLAESLQKKTTRVRVRLSVDKVDRRGLEALRETLGRFPGKCPVTLELTSPEKWAAIAGIGMSVAPTDGLLASLEKLFGEKVCELR